MPETLTIGSLGSSPLTRGAPIQERVVLVQQGLIPADAGSTVRRLRAAADPGGSSPLTRGALCPCVGGGTVTGLIPADAGSTPRRAASPAPPWAHPR